MIAPLSLMPVLEPEVALGADRVLTEQIEDRGRTARTDPPLGVSGVANQRNWQVGDVRALTTAEAPPVHGWPRALTLPAATSGS